MGQETFDAIDALVKDKSKRLRLPCPLKDLRELLADTPLNRETGFPRAHAVELVESAARQQDNLRTLNRELVEAASDYVAINSPCRTIDEESNFNRLVQQYGKNSYTGKSADSARYELHKKLGDILAKAAKHGEIE